MEVLQEIGADSEHALDMMTYAEIEKLEWFGNQAMDMIKEARGKHVGTEVDFTDAKSVEALIFGEEDQSINDDGLVTLELKLRIKPRRLDWLTRSSEQWTLANPHRAEKFTIPGMIIKFIDEACQRDSTDAGRRTGGATAQKD